MELYALRDGCSLRPCYDDDADKLRNIRNGRPVLITISEARSIRFHRRYFAMLNAAWDVLGEGNRKLFRENLDCFRRSLTVLAGFTDPVYNPRTGEWSEVPRSISFERMGEGEFRDLYDGTVRTLFECFIPNDCGRRAAFLSALSGF